MGHAEGTFKVTAWNEEPAKGLDEAAKVTQATIGQRFDGSIDADTLSYTVMTYREDGTADYLGYQKVVGRLDDRTGTFVLRSIGTYDGTEARAELAVVPGSATGELVGLRGTGSTAAGHGDSGTYELDYDLG